MNFPFIDPENRGPLTQASEAELIALRAAIANGDAKRRDGEALPVAFEGAYLGAARSHAYLVLDGIPNFLIDERVELSGPLK